MSRMTGNEFLAQANKIHNFFYDYSKMIYKTKGESIIVICPIHGEYKCIAKNHLKGTKCQACSGKRKKTLNEFIQEANIIHENKYDYSKAVYKNNKQNITIICKEHGEFHSKVGNHLRNKAGCPTCGNINIRLNSPTRLSTEKFIERCSKIHLNKFNYSKVNYISTNRSVEIICPTHGEFTQLAAYHLNGNGCPECSHTVSRGVKTISSFLSKKNIHFNREHKFSDCRNKYELPFDFFLPEYDLCIEYDGRQHFESIVRWGGDCGLKYRQLNDKIKNDYCTNSHLNLLRIKYSDNIEEILSLYFN